MQASIPNYNSRRALSISHSALPLGRQSRYDWRERMRASLRPPTGRGRGWAGLPALVGRFRPPTAPLLLFGPLTSNEEQAGREGRGCGGAGKARRARGRERRGHVTAALASSRGGGALPGSRSSPALAAAPKQLPARKQQLRAHPSSAGAGIPHLRTPSYIGASPPDRQGQPARPSPLLLGPKGRTARG